MRKFATWLEKHWPAYVALLLAALGLAMARFDVVTTSGPRTVIRIDRITGSIVMCDLGSRGVYTCP